MIEVKLSFSTAEELVSFFTNAQVQTIPVVLTTGAAQPEYQVNLPQGAVLKAGGTVEFKEEPALPEEPALKKPAKGKGKKETTQAGSGANNPGSAGSESLSSSAPSDAVAVSQPEAEAPAAEAPVADVKYTIDDARAALTRLNDRDGIDAVRTLLAQMGANRISELPVAKYGELIAACPSA